MQHIHVINEGDGAHRDIAEKMKAGKVRHHTGPLSISRLPAGMQSARTSIMIRADLEDGTTVLIETSLRAFVAASTALDAYDQFAATKGGQE